MSPTLPSAFRTAFSSMAMRRIFAALKGLFMAFSFAMKRVVVVQSVSMIFRWFARRLLPVSVISTMASAK